MGSFFFNFLGKFLINPENLLPSLLQVDGNEKYFTAEVALNLPFMFRALGCCYLVIAGIALCLIRDMSLVNEDEEEDRMTLAKSMKTKQFYQIFLNVIMSGAMGLFTIANFKNIGLGLNYGDSYVTFVGSVGGIINGTFRLGWGYLLDATSFRLTYSVLMIAQIGLACTFPFVFEDKYLFLVWVCLLFSCQGGTSTLLPPIAVKLYGEVAGVKVYAFFMLAFGIASIWVYFVQLFVLEYFGFAILFWFLALMSFCALVSNMFFKEKLDHRFLEKKLLG